MCGSKLKNTKKGSVFYNVTANAALSEDDLDALNAGPLAALPDGSLSCIDDPRFGENTAWQTAALA